MKDAELSKTAAKYVRHYEEYITSGLTSAEYCAQHNIDLKTWNTAITRLKQRGQLPQGTAHGHVNLQHTSDSITILDDDLKYDRDMLIRFYASGKSSLEWCTENGVALDTIDICKQRLLDKGIVCDRVIVADAQELSELQCQVIEVYEQHYENGISIFECCVEKDLNIVEVITMAADMHQTGLLPAEYNNKVDLSPQEMAAVRSYVEYAQSGKSLRNYCEEKNIGYGSLRSLIQRLRVKGILCRSQAKSQSLQEWLPLLHNFRTSGLSKAEWCRKNNISYSTLRSVEKRMEKAGALELEEQSEPELNEFQRGVCEIYKRHYTTGIPIGEYCKQNGLSKSSVMSTASRLRKKGILPKQLINEGNSVSATPENFDIEEVCSTNAKEQIDFKAQEKIVCENDVTVFKVVSTLRYGKMSVDIHEGISEQTLQMIIKALFECTHI